MAFCLVLTVLHAGLVLGLSRDGLSPRYSNVQSSCTVTQFEAISSATESCTNIVISNMNVPGGQMLSMTNLKKGTKITFAGRTVRTKHLGYGQYEPK